MRYLTKSVTGHPLRRCISVVTLILCMQNISRAQDAETSAELWQPFINETTIALVTFDAADIDTIRQQIVSRVDQSNRETLVRISANTKQQLELLRTGTAGEDVLIAVDVPYSLVQSPLRIYLPNRDAEATAKLAQSLGFDDEHRFAVDGFTLLTPAGYPAKAAHELHRSVVELFQNSAGKRADTRSRFSEAMDAVGDKPMKIAIAPPEYIRTTFRDLLPTLPPELGNASTTVIIDGAKWVGIGIDPSDPSGAAVIQSETPAAANAFAEALPEMIQSIANVLYGNMTGGKSPESESLETVVHTAVQQILNPTVKGDQIHIEATEQRLEESITLAAALFNKALGSFASRKSINQFKQILIAMHNYHATHKTFPPGPNVKSEATSGLSWRVHLLPFIDHGELYRQFRLDEPWDSEHNRTLIENMPSLYAKLANIGPLREIPAGHTSYQLPIGENSVFGGDEPTAIRDIIDGTSNTILLVEVKPELAVPWTKPQDYEYATEEPLAGIEVTGGRFLAGFADGSIQQIGVDQEGETILHLFQKNDGNVINLR